MISFALMSYKKISLKNAKLYMRNVIKNKKVKIQE